MNVSVGTNNNKLVAVVLAAGQSQRFGGVKQLADLHGTPMVNHAIAQLPVHSNSIFVVLGANAEQIKAVLNPQVSVIENPRWQGGMSQSIMAATSYIIANLKDQCDRMLVVLADQAQLSRDDYLRLISASEKHKDKIVAASFHQTYGAPVIFPSAFFTTLMKIQGDKGAKKIIAQHMDQTVLVEMEAAGIDIDTKKQLNYWMQS